MNRIQPDTSLPKQKVYKIYTALLTQINTGAPIPTVLHNNLGFEITWNRTGPGDYYAEWQEPITGTLFILTQDNVVDVTTIIDTTTYSTNSFSLYTLSEGTPTDDGLFKTPIEIRIYN